MDLAQWSGVPRPQKQVIEGQYVDLVPLQPELHASDLYQVAIADGVEERFRYLPERPFANRDDFYQWITEAAASEDPLFYAVVDRDSGKAEGRQALMRIDEASGSIEIGNIMWGPNLARTRAATEALFLSADYIFSLGYRRFEWKCDDNNEPSKRAANRFGFSPEGVFRQHRIVKGLNRDTAWFSIMDYSWPAISQEYVRWLAPENFDSEGTQLSRLEVKI